MTEDPVAVLDPQIIARHRLFPCPQGDSPPPDLRLPENVAPYVRAMVAQGHRRREHLGGLLLDDFARPLAYTLPYVGYLGRTPLDSGAFLSPGMLLLAGGLVTFHNRVRGKLTVSRRIWSLLRQVREASEVVGVRLLDHLVLGPEGGWLSLHNANRARFHALGDAPRSDGRKRVQPKYRHPEHAHLTWSGRGRMASWLKEALDAGARLEDFALEE